MITKTFDEACLGIADFLQRKGQSPELLWICREEVTGRRCEFFVHPSPSPINRRLYERYFEFGVRQARGVLLSVFCFVNGQACCYVWFPEDDVAASERMFGDNLRFGYALEGSGPQRGRQAARSCCSAAFFIRRVWSRWCGESPQIQELPSRGDLLSIPNDRNA